MASGEASERSKATGGYVALGLQLVGWRAGRQIAREAPDAFPPEVAASGRRRITVGLFRHIEASVLKHSRIVDGLVRSDMSTGGSGWGDLTAIFGQE